MHVALVQIPTSGHVNPTLDLIAALADRGHRVSVTTTPAWAQAVRDHGGEFRDMTPGMPPDVDLDHPPPALLETAALLARATGGLMGPTLDTLSRDRPDVVVHDAMASWGRQSADLLRIPRVCSSATFAVHPRMSASPSGLLEAAREVVAGRRGMRDYHRAAAALRRDHGVRLGAPPSMFMNRGDAPTVVYTSAALQPGARHLGPSVHYVGPRRPLTDGNSGTVTDGLPDGPLVYVSLGTLFNQRPDFFRACAAALADEPMGVVLSVGHDLDPAALGPLPPNVHVRASVDQRAVLERADVFVTHGGMNSVHEALVTGTPMVVVPQAADQPLVARRLDELGAAVWLRGAHPGPEAIRAAVHRARRPEVRAAAAALGADMLRLPGPAGAADVVERAAAD